MHGNLRNYPPLSERLNTAWDNHANLYRDALTGLCAGTLALGLGWVMGAYVLADMLEFSLRPVEYVGLGFGCGFFSSLTDRNTL